jgi:hypothetical protein
MAHLDTSRSGLLFHPRLIRWLAPWINAQAAATLVGATEPLLARSRGGRGLLAAARSLLGAGLVLLIERELRGEDVPGANDNASGVAVCLQLASELAERPPESTRTVVLLTGCEESGSLGAQHFLRGRDTRDWLFLNFDNVGAGSLHYLAREGLARKWEADPGLAGLAGEIAAADPALGLAPAEGQIGLIYDATPVLARGGRALTFVAAVDGIIPNYHRPSDTSENVDPAAVGRALAVGRQMVAAIDSGEADA